jgi:glycosyltransferase involved in cell wall biosynthesis
MKVLFQTRKNYLTHPGGDTVQLLNTKLGLEKLGITVVINNDYEIDLTEFHIVHIFNIIRPLDTYLYINNAKKYNIKIVVSSIFWSMKGIPSVDFKTSVVNLLKKFAGYWATEKIKSIIRNDQDLKNSKENLVAFLMHDYKKLLQSVDIFLPNSYSELNLLNIEFGKVNGAVVTNAVDKNLFYLNNYGVRNKSFISVTRSDPRKNVNNLISAFKRNQKIIDIYCSKSPQYDNYFNRLISQSDEKIKFYSTVKNQQLQSIYSQYFAHILPSWAETPGLVQLEAAACGCNIISTINGSAKEYFGSMAQYCDPSSIESIVTAIEFTLDNPKKPNDISDYVLSNFTWDKAALQTHKAYLSILI